MIRIPLTKNQFALVNDGDYEELAKFKWQAHWEKSTNSFYAVRAITKPKTKQLTVRMSREIMGLKAGNKLQVDHINHDTLDNRRINLRIVTASQNRLNSGKQKNNTSGFKGVSFNKPARKFQAHIRLNNKNKHLGLFTSETLAHEAYIKACKEFHGEFALLD